MSPTEEEYDALIEMLKERMHEGQGETIYAVGSITDGNWNFQ